MYLSYPLRQTKTQHGQYLLDSFHFIPPYFQPKGMLPQEAILKNPTQKALFDPFDLKSYLCEPVDVRPQTLLLALDDFAQSGFSHWPPLLDRKVHR